MSWHWILVAFLAGGLGGYIACDRMTTEQKITYVIKKLRAKKGGEISVDGEAVIEGRNRKEERKQRRDARKNK